MGSTPTASDKRPPGAVHIVDTSICVWEEPQGSVDGPYESAFQRQVFAGVVRLLRERGWSVKRDPWIHERWPVLDERHRHATHPSRLEAVMEVSGRFIKIELFQSVANVDHGSVARYVFDKMKKMPYLIRLRAVEELAAVVAWLCASFGYAQDPRTTRRELLLGERSMGMRARAELDRDQRNRSSGAANEWMQSYNRTARDGLLSPGVRVYYTDDKGRWGTGIAEYNINNMWWIMRGGECVENKATHQLQMTPPVTPRIKDNQHMRRQRLEQLMHEAAQHNEFLRAEQLRRVLFGDQETYRIRHREKGYYSIQSRGYAAAAATAGQYTEKEAGFARRAPGEFVVEPVQR